MWLRKYYRCEKRDRGSRVTGTETIIQLLKERGLAYERTTRKI